MATDETFQNVVYEKQIDVVDLAPQAFGGSQANVSVAVTPTLQSGEYVQGLFGQGYSSDGGRAITNLTVKGT